MALNAYPFENANTTEDQYTLLFRNFADSGIVGNYGDSQFAVTTDGSGLDVQVAAGYAILRGHAVQNDGPMSIPLDAADSANPRLDRLVLRLDPSADGITFAVIKGTPAPTPLAPAITRTDTGVWDLPLATIKVNANALNVVAADITSNRTWGGHKFGVWTTADRPTDPYIGKPGFNITINGAEVWNGTAWESVVTKRKIVIPHTFTLAGPIAVPTAAGDYFIPPMFIAELNGQECRIVGARSKVFHGPSNSTVNFDIKSNGFNVFSGTASFTPTNHSFTAFPVSHGYTLELVVTGIVATPKNATVTIYVEYEA